MNVLTPYQDRTAVTRIVSYVLAGLALYFCLKLHLLAGVLAGLLVYELVTWLAPLLERRLVGERARLAAVATLAIVTIFALIGLIMGTVAFFRSDTGSLPMLAAKVQLILNDARDKLPPSVVEDLPDTVGGLRDYVKSWADAHKQELGTFSRDASHLFLNTVIGMIVGALISLREQRPGPRPKALSAACTERISRFADAFRRIMVAQVRISALNTCLTGIFVLIILPLFGIHLPLSKALVVITFITGLLPVFGNLISNSIVTIVAVSVSLSAGIAALVFLILIHKLEYFLNAKIVGSRIHARAWELLIAMFVMEAAFGIQGLIAAPIYYAYLKSELTQVDLI
ncbi:MAG: AI-2E family transporter [Verrucomicrobia bacterium]|nr:AI-2E family transporter [Verrucomicrobiota bacterium]